MKSLGTSGSATRRDVSYKVGGTLEEICLEQVLWTWGSATMIRTPHEGRCMDDIGFICDDTIRIEVSNFIGLFCLSSMVFPLDLTMFIEVRCGPRVRTLL